jgi:ribosome-binding protein aMBF1 (putative translation factor)
LFVFGIYLGIDTDIVNSLFVEIVKMKYTICGIEISKENAIKIAKQYVKVCEYCLLESKTANMPYWVIERNTNDLRKAHKLLKDIQ